MTSRTNSSYDRLAGEYSTMPPTPQINPEVKAPATSHFPHRAVSSIDGLARRNANHKAHRAPECK